MKLFVFNLFTFSIFLAFFFVLPNISSAKSPESFNLISQDILPGDSKYKIKRLKERTTDFFKILPKSKSAYREMLLEMGESASVFAKENFGVKKIIDKYERYLEGELSKARLKEGKVREKMRKEKKAIMLSIRAKRLRSPKK